MPAACASRQVTPPVECTSTSAAASSSGILSVKPYTCTRGSSAKLPRSFCASCSLRPARQTMLADLGHARELAHGAGDVADAPAAAGDDDHAPVLGQPERAARLRAGSAARGTRPRSAAARAARCPRPAMRSTDGIDSPYMTRCMSIPGCAQKNRPVRSVIVATVGQLIAPRRRSRASTTVTAG